MRGVSVLIMYLLGLGAIISFGIAGLMALRSPIKQTPSAPAAAVSPHKEVAAKPVKQTTRKDAQKRKMVNTTRKRMEEKPTVPSSGLDAYGSADEPHRFYLNPFRFFGR